MEIKLQQRLSQQLVMTPQLQQAIKLLQLSRLELIDLVREEMMENPILEDQAEGPESEKAAVERSETPSIDQLAAIEERRENAPQNPEEQRASSESREEEYWERFLEAYSNQSPLPSAGTRQSSEDLPSLEATLSNRTSLSDYLESQLRMSLLTEDEMRFAMLVINNLDENGYLTLKGVPRNEPVKEKEKKEKASDERGFDDDDRVAAKPKEPAPPPTQTDEGAQITLTVADLAREAGLDPEDADEVLKVIQGLDPVGVAPATSASACSSRPRTSGTTARTWSGR